MKQSTYQAIHDFVTARPALRQAVILCTKLLPGIVYVSYPLMLVYLFLTHSHGFLRALLVPAAGFLTVTVLRAAINAPRPYECPGIPSVSPKDTKGKSFPSRHAACAAVIAVTTLHELPLPGILLSAIALLIGLSRVLAGVHFLRDVLCGLLLGGFLGWAGMYLIP